MRNALRPTRADVPAALPTSLVAPTGGWNARDAIANMPITDAEIMDNWFPEGSDVRTRTGMMTYLAGAPGQVETIFSYAKGTTLQLFCAVGTQFYNAGSVGLSSTILATATVNTGLTNARWQYTAMGNGVGGEFLVAVNGVDQTQIYDGSSWFAQTVVYSGGSTIHASNITTYNKRIFYTETNTLRFAYHEQVNAIGGTVTPFDLSGYMSLGGYLMGLDTWTRDAGSGPDDYIVFISNKGQAAVYVGTDPGNASNWTLVGVYTLPPPLGPRCTQKFGGDLLIATWTGVYPLSSAVNGPVQEQSAISDKIRNKVTEAAKLYNANFGWDLKVYQNGHWLILNVPKTTATDVNQFIMNTNTGAWCRFLGWQANCFQIHNNALYFGASNAIYKADVQQGISVGDNGTVINVDVKQAASNFDLPGRLKQFKLFKPQIASDGGLPIAMGVDVDFSNVVPTNIPTPGATPFATWDQNDWDTCYWADDPYPQPQWQGITGLGTYGSVRMVGMTTFEDIRWYGTDIILEPGEMV